MVRTSQLVQEFKINSEIAAAKRASLLMEEESTSHAVVSKHHVCVLTCSKVVDSFYVVKNYMAKPEMSRVRQQVSCRQTTLSTALMNFSENCLRNYTVCSNNNSLSMFHSLVIDIKFSSPACIRCLKCAHWLVFFSHAEHVPNNFENTYLHVLLISQTTLGLKSSA